MRFDRRDMSLFTSDRERRLWSMEPSSFGEPRPIAILDSFPAINFPVFGSVAAGGAAVAVFQWLMLRRYIGGTIRWMLASSLGLFLSAQVVGRGIAIPAVDRNGPPGWAIFGAITGTALVLLLRQERVTATGTT